MAQKRKRKERKIIPNIVDTSFRSNAQGQRTHSARTKKLGAELGQAQMKLDIDFSFLSLH